MSVPIVPRPIFTMEPKMSKFALPVVASFVAWYATKIYLNLDIAGAKLASVLLILKPGKSVLIAAI